jgi:hypothetical protein
LTGITHVDPTALVQKLWNYYNILRDDGVVRVEGRMKKEDIQTA